MFKRFFSRLMANKVFCIVFSILIAFALWFYIDTVENPEDDTLISNIPLSFVGQEMLEGRNLMLGDGTEQTISIRVRGKKTVLGRLNKDNVGAYVDLSEIKTTGEKYQGYNITFPDWVDEDAITVYEWLPRNVSYSVIERTSREVEITGKLLGEVAEGYLLDSITCTPAVISISGPQEIIDRVVSAEARLELEEINTSIATTVPIVLLDTEGKEIPANELTLSAEETTVQMNILTIRTVPLLPDIIDGGGATDKDVTVKVMPDTIELAGTAETLAGISRVSVGTVDLSKFNMSLEQSMTILIPDNVKNVTGITSAKGKVDVSSDFEMKRVSVDRSRIGLVNAEGLNAALVTESVDVTVRGKSDILEKVDAAHIRIVVDLEDAAGTKGIVPIKARVYVDGYAQAGAIGEYTVMVQLN